MKPENLTANEVLERLYLLANNIYWAMFNAGVSSHAHAVMEFCGLINEYLSMCSDALRNGVDFRECNIHSGRGLPMKPCHARFVGEKLACIYGPSLRDKANARAFLEALGLSRAVQTQHTHN